MAGTFFGFDTSLPINEDDGLNQANSSAISKREDADSKNDETFNVDVSGLLTLISNNDSSGSGNAQDNQKNGNGIHLGNFLTKKYDSAKDMRSEEERAEEEIIENSISQLGLDDEVDDTNVHPAQKLEDDHDWNSHPGKDSFNDSSILMQDLLSPDKRGIWTSPYKDSASGSFGSPKSNAKTDILDGIFSKASNTDRSQLQHGEKPMTPVKAIRAEDLEKGLSAEKSFQSDRETPVIIERRLPRTPAPPPGFLFPFGTPPSGLPLMTPPGMMPMPSMMLSGQMQRMLAASPHMQMFGGRGMPPHPMIPIPSPLMQSPMERPHNDRGRFQNSSNQRARRDHDNFRYNRNQQNKHWNRRDNNRDAHRDFEHDIIKLPPSRLMTSKEKEWLVKIQLMALVSDDMQAADYYYINYMKKKSMKDRQQQECDDNKKNGENDNYNKLLDIVEQKKEERKYRPAVFEGSLGKLTCATVHHPRQLMDLAVKDQEEEEIKKTNEGAKKRFIVFGTIENAYSLLLEIESIEKKLNDVSEEERNDVMDQKRIKTSELFNMLKLSENNWQKDKVKELFLQIMCIAKGKRLLLRALPHFNSKQIETVFLSTISGLQLLIKKDLHDKILEKFVLILPDVMKNADQDFIRNILAALSSANTSHLLASSVGLNLFSCLLEHIQELEDEASADDTNIFKKEWESLNIEITNAITNISSKSLQKHSSEIARLKGLLHPPVDAHASEE